MKSHDWIIAAMKRVFPMLLAGLGTLLVVGSAAWGLLDNAVRNPAAISLPDHVAGLDRSQYIVGRQAVSEFGNLHGEQFPVTSGAVAVYADSQITIWAAGTPFGFMANQLVAAMHRKISEGESPFTEIITLTDRGREIFVLQGMGQRHYYFRSQNLVIWLAAEPALAEQALSQILEEYP